MDFQKNSPKWALGVCSVCALMIASSSAAQSVDRRAASVSRERAPMMQQEPFSFFQECIFPLKKLLEAGEVSPGQSLASTGIPGCQLPGADDITVEQAVNGFLDGSGQRPVSP